MFLRALMAGVWLTALGSTLVAEPSPSKRSPENADALRVKRLAALGKLWGAVKFFHPYLAYREIDWDAALIAAIPKVRAAKNPDEYAAAVQSMLGNLCDPATRVLLRPPTAVAAAPQPVVTRWTEDQILIVTASNFFDFQAKTTQFQAIGKDLPKARGILFDLRAAVVPQDSLVPVVFTLSEMEKRLSSAPLEGPGQRIRMHSGLRSEEGGSWTPPAGA